MHCSDLERYLEACLDGQLGESRRLALKDHLALCGTCRERVDGLRRFEADLQQRLRSMRYEASLWQPLGLEAVAGGAAPPRVVPLVAAPLPRVEPNAAGPAAAGTRPAQRGHRLRIGRTEPAGRAAAGGPAFGRRLQGLAGIALIVAAVVTVTDLALSGLGRLAGDRPTTVYRAYLEGGVELDLRTAEAARLSHWLGAQLGAPVALPSPQGGFALVGGKATLDGAAERTALAVYATEAGPALLLIGAAAGDAASEPTTVIEDGLTRLDWQDGGHAYSLIAALPPEKLALFAD